MKEKISFNVDHEILQWLEDIKKYYKKEYLWNITNRSDLLRNIIMKEYFRIQKENSR